MDQSLGDLGTAQALLKVKSEKSKVDTQFQIFDSNFQICKMKH